METDTQRRARIKYQASARGQEMRRRAAASPAQRARRLAYGKSAAGRAGASRRRMAVGERIREIARLAGCADCGIHAGGLELHHRDPQTKVRAVTSMCGMAWVRIEAEMAKCDILCAACHRKRHGKSC